MPVWVVFGMTGVSQHDDVSLKGVVSLVYDIAYRKRQ